MKNRHRPRDLGGLAPRSQRDLQVLIETDDLVRPEAWLERLQGVLRPGAVAHVRGPGVQRGGRALRRRATHYFDVAAARGELRLTRRSTAAGASHFESLAPTYWDEIPAHIQEHFFQKKIGILQEALPRRERLVGLDLGCGVGRYADEVQRRVGGRVVGLDPTRNGLLEARQRTGVRDLAVGDVLRLPFRTATFDYCYTINVLHHLKRGEQERGLREIRRVLRPDGVLVVHEMNTRNAVFRWYLRRIYPKIRPIDRGDEEFIDPRRWPLVEGWRVQELRHMTFVPDFAPRIALAPLRKIEGWLERGASRAYSAHYAVVLRPN